MSACSLRVARSFFAGITVGDVVGASGVAIKSATTVGRVVIARGVAKKRKMAGAPYCSCLRCC